VSEENHEETRSGRLFERRTETGYGFSVNVLGEGVPTFGREREMSVWLNETEERDVIQWGANTWFREIRDQEELSVTSFSLQCGH
jgi:hypothetical protein